jgi:uncharacterized membrane protein
MSTGRPRAGVSLGLALVLGLGALVLAESALIKRPCAGGDWADGRQYRRYCYTDIVPLYTSEQLTQGRLPYLEPCADPAGPCDEYPLLTMYFMRAAAWIADGLRSGAAGFADFFYVNAALLALLALGTVWLLYRMVGTRAAYFALAPTLLIYAFVNWDLLAVFLATLGTYLALRNRGAGGGAALGLGTAAKLYPGMLTVPFALDLRSERRGEALLLLVWTGVTWAALNLPFALAASTPWFTFFRFNSERPADWDSLWFVICQRLEGGTGCEWSPALINAGAAVLFVAGGAVVWVLRRRRQPDFPAWTFAFPLLVVFLLTSKVYSPQFSLWLLPWFALALPNLWLFVAFQAADVAVFLTRFAWFGRLGADLGDSGLAGYEGVPLGAFQIALVARAVVLVLCVVAWIRAASTDQEPALQAETTAD